MSEKNMGRGRGRGRPRQEVSSGKPQRFYESEEQPKHSTVTTQIEPPPVLTVKPKQEVKKVPIVKPSVPQGSWAKIAAVPRAAAVPVSIISSIEEQQSVGVKNTPIVKQSTIQPTTQPQINKPPSVKSERPVTPKKDEKPQAKPTTLLSPNQKPQQSSIEPSDISIASNTFKFPPKPTELCSLGREISLKANHFGVSMDKPITVYHYDVQITRLIADKSKKRIETDVSSKAISKKVFQKLLKLNPTYTNKIFYDFSKSLYSIDKLPEPFEKTVPDIEGKEYVLKLKLAGDVIRTIHPNQPTNDTELQVALQILQTMMTHRFSVNLTNIGRSFFPKDCTKHELGLNVNLWKGFYASVRPAQMGFNINMDVANAVFFEEGMNLVDLAMKFYKCKNASELAESMRRDRESKFSDSLKGKKVKLTHLNFTKQVERLATCSSNEHLFDHNGRKLTVTQYFKEVHNIVLRYPDLPCVCLGKQNNTPLELCTTELSILKKLPPRMTSEMIKKTAVPCTTRRADIEKLVVDSGLKSDPILDQFNIKTDMKMVEFKGRVVAAPDLQFNNFKLDSKKIGTEGQWDNRNKKFFVAKELVDWIVVYSSNRMEHNTVCNFIDGLMKTAKTHGLKVKDPLNCVYIDPRSNPIEVKSHLDSLIQQHNNQIRLIFAILHKERTTDIYNALKAYGDLEKGIQTQALDDNSIIKCDGRFDCLASNLCLKINNKLGGINFILSQENPLLKQYLQELYNGPLMMIGADVNHPSPGDGDTTESIAAAVGSIDKDCSYYVARIMRQKQLRGQSLELIYDLAILVRGLLNEYFKANRVFPKRIVFLRDGVSEGQFSKMGHEINEIRKACQDVGGSGYKPGLTFLVVQKRHHTRLFPTYEDDKSGKNGNVPPGTMVDTKIVTPRMFDFFLCSHMGIQGTSKPCHYFLIHDENNFNMNGLSLLCHYLCHIYQRSSTSVSYPAPTYYADLCAERGRVYLKDRCFKDMLQPTEANQYISREIILHEYFQDKMFFI